MQRYASIHRHSGRRAHSLTSRVSRAGRIATGKADLRDAKPCTFPKHSVLPPEAVTHPTLARIAAMSVALMRSGMLAMSRRCTIMAIDSQSTMSSKASHFTCRRQRRRRWMRADTATLNERGASTGEMQHHAQQERAEIAQAAMAH